MRVAVVGLGHVGGPLSAVLRRHHEVFGVDRDPTVPGAGPPPEEPVDIVVIAVPTPLGPEGPELSAVHAAAVRGVRWLVPDGLLVLASTCPVGTARGLAEALGRDVVSLPERGIPERMTEEMVQLDRLVGGTSPAATARAAAWVRTWCRGRVHEVTAEEAELVKLVENSWRDVSIAFVNDLATTAEAMGLDPARLVTLAEGHPRVALARPGIGVGGHCLPVDPHFLPATMTMSAAARAANTARTRQVLETVRAAVRARGATTVGVLGLTYKPEVADLRHSPALALAEALGALAHDPLVAEATTPSVRRGSVAEVLACDLVVKLVAHGTYDSLTVDLDLT